METEAVDVAGPRSPASCATALIAREPLGEITGLVADCFSHLVFDAAHLWYLDQTTRSTSPAREKIERLAKTKRFEGRLVILAEPALRPAIAGSNGPMAAWCW